MFDPLFSAVPVKDYFITYAADRFRFEFHFKQSHKIIRIIIAVFKHGYFNKFAGSQRAVKTFEKIVAAMKSDGFDGGIVYIDHVANESGAMALKDRIVAEWPQALVRVVPCGGLCSYYAERDGFIIGFGWPSTQDGKYFTIEE